MHSLRLSRVVFTLSPANVLGFFLTAGLLGLPSNLKASLPSANLGSVAVGSSGSASISIPLTSAPSGARVVSLHYGTDFTAGTCPANSATCTVTVTFAPTKAGLRQDGVVIKDSGGNVLAEAMVFGKGLAPQVTFDPGVAHFLYSDTNLAYGVHTFAADSIGNTYWSTGEDHVINRLTPGSLVPTVIAGQVGALSIPSGDGGLATAATIAVPGSIVIDGAENIYFTDLYTLNFRITVRRIDAATGIITTIAGSVDPNVSGPEPVDGAPATSGTFSSYAQMPLAVDLRGDVYLYSNSNGSQNPAIRKVDRATGLISTIAGGSSSTHSGDGGPATAAGFSQIQAMHFDSAGNLFVLEGLWLRKIDAITGVITTIAGNGSSLNSGLGGPAVNATINASTVVVDSFDNLYLNNGQNNEIDRINLSSGLITYFAGGQYSHSPAEGLLSNRIDFGYASDKLAFDADGNYYECTQTYGLFKINVVTPGYTFLSEGASYDYPSPLNMSVNNAGNQNLIIAGDNITGSFTAALPSTSACSFPETLTSKTSCSLALSPIPSTGNVNGSLSLTDNALNQTNATQPASLSFIYPQPTVPGSLDLGAVALGGFPFNQNLLIQNLSAAPFTVDHLTIQGPNASDFTAANTCFSINVNNPTCFLPVGFSPTGIGVRTATLLIYGNTAAPLSVSLTGTGGVASLSVSSTQLVFQQTQWGTSSTQTSTVTNTSALPIYIASPYPLPIETVFHLDSSCAPGQATFAALLMPGQQCVFSVSFNPQGQVGEFDGSYQLASNFSGVAPLLTFHGTSGVTGPALTFGQLPLTFSANRNSTSAMVPLSLKNAGSMPASISSIALTGAQSADFREFNNCPAQLAAAESCVVWAGYSPGASSALSSTAVITVTGGRSLAATEAVSGSVVETAAIRSVIDTPAPGSTVSGTITVSGWAGLEGAAVSTLSLSVDGVLVDYPVGHLPRADVCAAYPSITDCPNPGWSLRLDTTRFSDGDHTLAIIAGGQTSATVGTKIKIANGDAANATKFTIDFPSDGQVLSDQVQFSGWALGSSENVDAYVNAYIDGVGVFVQTNPRPDVCTAYHRIINCDRAGWSFPFDTRSVANGDHTVSFVVIDSAYSSNHYTLRTLHFKVQNSSHPITLTIETPAEGQTVAGTIDVSGWTLSNTTQIYVVTAVLADGMSGSPNYLTNGIQRDDVCRAYPNGLNCPYPGFLGSLSTSSLTTGPHTLFVTASATDGTSYTAARRINVANVLDASTNQLLVNVDAPASNAILSGTAGISGWVVDGLTYNPSVDLTIDNVPVGSAFSGYNRPDVCAAFPFGKSCPNVGWIGAIDTTLLVDGPHTLGVTATSSTGKRTKKTVPFIANNSAAHLTNGQLLNIEVPAANQNVSGAISIAGWAVSAAAPVDEVNILIDGVPMGSAQYGLPRADVCAAYPNSQSCPNVGWGFVLDTRTLTNGVHSIEAVESTSHGDAAVTQKFTVSNDGTVTAINAVIDSPAPNATISGNYLIAGWAIDDGDLIATVALNVDGLPQGFAAYGGARADVCAVFPGGQNCPNAGWNSYLDTTRFDNGAHTLSVVVTSTHGDVATFTRTLNVGN